MSDLVGKPEDRFSHNKAHIYVLHVNLKTRNKACPSFTLQVMLISCPTLDDLYHRSCSLSQDPEGVREDFVHPTRLVNFLVGVKGKNEPIAIGGPWSPSLDGENPTDDPQVLIKTAVRTCKALTGINLSQCTQW